ncbi:MAG: helix-turn-helix transcriptional regulator [Candidatus Cloacimonetes bacterium]|nr:helix-turn-helix transcriptional regulator [Candidatus Cloacimonadota bacterium]
MKWQGEKIREFLKEKKITQKELADKLKVTRPTVSDWIKGKIPKGKDLLALCQYFDIRPNDLFIDDTETLITVPQHRMRRNAKLTDEVNQLSYKLAHEYLGVFRNYQHSLLVQTFRDQDLTYENAKQLAYELRQLINLDDKTPINYELTFDLLNKLGVFVIFSKFPVKIKSYAFNCEISNKKVMFVNIENNVLDLIFQLLHEVIHLVKGDRPLRGYYDEVEEKYCDLVASYIQFPDNYINLIYDTIIEFKNEGRRINFIKRYSSEYGHAGFGVVKRIKEKHPDFSLNIAPADENLKKGFPTIGEIIHASKNARDFVNVYQRLSPNLIDLITYQLDGLSTRKIAEMLNIESNIDAISVWNELNILRKQRGAGANTM